MMPPDCAEQNIFSVATHLTKCMLAQSSLHFFHISSLQEATAALSTAGVAALAQHTVHVAFQKL